MKPFAHQLTGALFLANRDRALLADQPRVGKTGSALLAADYIFARSILIVTTVSGLAVWRKAIPEWSGFPRKVFTVRQTASARPVPAEFDVAIVSWSLVGDPYVRAALSAREWDLLIVDESHYAKNPETKRTQGIWGDFLDDGANVYLDKALAGHARVIWCLTGTPIPNAPNDLWPMLRVMMPDRLGTRLLNSAFVKRFCIVKFKKTSTFRKIPVVVAGKHEDELSRILRGFYLRRTQKDIGLQPPIYEMFPLSADGVKLAELEADVDRGRVLAAAKRGDTAQLEYHLGTLRRLTGEIKAELLADAICDDLASGLDKVVVMAWHHGVIDTLVEKLAAFNPVTVDGRILDAQRERNIRAFGGKRCRVIICQIQAGGEAIDLSAAPLLYFCETSFVPKDMAQAALRITGPRQTRQAIVRVCALEGSIDGAAEAILMRKWASIKKVIA